MDTLLIIMELKDIQEKTKGDDYKGMVEKCIKLTADLSAKQSEIKIKGYQKAECSSFQPPS